MTLDKEITRVKVGGDIYVAYDISEDKSIDHLPSNLHKLKWVDNELGDMVFENEKILIREIKQLL